MRRHGICSQKLAAPRAGSRAARDHARAVLRPRLRLRDHAGLAPAARHLNWTGAGQATLVLLVVWWSWNYTTWVTNELNPESIAVRLLLIGADAGQPPDGDRDPGGVRRQGAAVRRLVRRDPGGAPSVPDLRRGRARHQRARPGGAHPDLVRRRGRALDRGRARRRLGADRALAGGARARLRRRPW